MSRPPHTHQHPPHPFTTGFNHHHGTSTALTSITSSVISHASPPPQPQQHAAPPPPPPPMPPPQPMPHPAYHHQPRPLPRRHRPRAAVSFAAAHLLRQHLPVPQRHVAIPVAVHRHRGTRHAPQLLPWPGRPRRARLLEEAAHVGTLLAALIQPPVILTLTPLALILVLHLLLRIPCHPRRAIKRPSRALLRFPPLLIRQPLLLIPHARLLKPHQEPHHRLPIRHPLLSLRRPRHCLDAFHRRLIHRRDPRRYISSWPDGARRHKRDGAHAVRMPRREHPRRRAAHAEAHEVCRPRCVFDAGAYVVQQRERVGKQVVEGVAPAGFVVEAGVVRGAARVARVVPHE
ncbi:hypothetical protein ACCO45_009760 [Purpureocillium lilacinum]|uniref:Uncharacterized protein n=1 Tax=Purpureocillium lilacinum TaxID=33203 RepID=A0ACC4DKT0_PURLI